MPSDKPDTTVLRPIGNKRVKARIEAFCQLVEENKDKAFYVCAHDTPDPDAMGSAFGMMRILSFLGVEEVSGWYRGEISHPQNVAMQNILSIPVKLWSKETEKEVPEDAFFIFVDCAGQQRNMSIPFAPKIVIDHHKSTPDKGALFIHDEIGSCSTLITDMMLSMPVREVDETKFTCFDVDEDDMREIATALAIGIKTDTIDFRNETTSDDDFKAYKLLTRFMSDDRYSKIVNYELPSYIFESEKIAWENRHQEGPNLITGLGFLDTKRGDCVPYNADHLMRLQGIQTVMVFAIVGNAVRVSIRTTSASIDAGTLCGEIFGEGHGGGKTGSAGANVSFNVFDPEALTDDNTERLWELTRSTIAQKFQRATQT